MLPFLVLIVLIVPDVMATLFTRWSAAERAMCANITRVLCFVGVLRALGFLGPPLLDGLGHPQLTLRYMVVSAVLTTGGYVIGAKALEDLGPMSVAIAWATFYPLAFAVLMYLVVKTISLPLHRYVRASRGIVGCALLAWIAGFGVDLATRSLPPLVRMVAMATASLVVLLVLLGRYQGISIRSIKAAVAATPSPPGR